MTAFRLELRRDRSLAVWLGLTMAGYAAVISAMYPVMVENDALFTAYMDTFPKEILAAFGMTGSLSDPGVFFTSYISAWLWPIMAAVVALLAGTRVAADLERGFLDLPLATPLSRTRHLAVGILGQALVMAVLAIATVATVWIIGTAVGGSFDAGRFAVVGVLCWLFGIAIAGVTTLLAVVTLSRGRASGLVGGILVVMYLLFVVGQVSTDWGWLAQASAWNHFQTTDLIDRGVIPAGDMLLFAMVAVTGWALALVAFRRRDLAA